MVTHTIQCVDSLVIMRQHNTTVIVTLALVTCQFYIRHLTATVGIPPYSTVAENNGMESAVVTLEW